MSFAKNKFTAVLLFSLSTLSAFAQNDEKKDDKGVGNQEVIVVKEYEATIQDAQKINIQPAIPDIPATSPKLEYNVPANDFKDIAFDANPLKPLSISKEKLEKYNTSFAKIGFGSQLSPLVQLAYNDNKVKNLKYGIFYNHFSAYGFKIKNQRYSDDEAGAYLKYNLNKTELGANFTFENYRTHFYGTDIDYSEKTVRQVFRTYNGNVYFKNIQKNKAEIDFNQTLGFNYLQETYGKGKEWYIDGNTNLQKAFLKNHAVTFDFYFWASNLKHDTTSLSRTVFTPMIGYAFNNDDWKAHAKIGVAVVGKVAVLAADIHLEKRLYQHSVIGYIDYQHNNQINSLSTLSRVNNFIYDNVDIKNSTVGDLGVGIKGTLTDFSYNVAFHLVHGVNLPFFVNDSADMKRFNVVYDPNVLIPNLHFEGGYNAKEWLRLLLLADYNFYHTKVEQYAWNSPPFKVTLRGNYVWKNKISATLDLYGITNSHAKLPGGQTTILKGTADINIGLEYLFNKHISFFGVLNNIAHIKYQRFYNYPSYGINGLVGAKFSF